MFFTLYAVSGVSIGILVAIAVLLFGGGLWAMFAGYVAGAGGAVSLLAVWIYITAPEAEHVLLKDADNS
ncbi:hypothetical protein [Celeribacter sp.]|uniref:hypothetical protein n=1 Tax=Celeribacter sp. TaxID=1890673 RepID=UPI003A8F5F83